MSLIENCSPKVVNVLKFLTAQPGVYRMLDANGSVLYVGKATNLKKRVRSYFSSKQLSPKTKSLVSQIDDIEITVTRSEKEALLLECTLIKKLQPKYNILMRDDKSFPYIYVQQGHRFPRMKAVRLKSNPEKAHYFGPYPNASNVYATLHLLQRIFKLRDCQDSDFSHRTRPCLQYQIKRCSAPCVGLISAKDYQQSVKDALAFLQGKHQAIFKNFQDAMEDAVERLAFEEAAMWRDRIKNLRMIQEQQSMIGLQGELDVVVLAIDAGVVGIARVVIREGKVISSETFFPKVPNLDWYVDEQALWQELFSDFIGYYYQAHPSQIPPLILTSRTVSDSSMLLEVLQELSSKVCAFQVPVRGIKKEWLSFAENNLQQALKTHRSSWITIFQRYQALSKFLDLPGLSRMECFDISHTQGSLTVASCVVFDEHGPSKKDYRRYNIEGIQPGDDYAAMQQVLMRRSKVYIQNPEIRPQLVIIDGGKGQVSVAKDILKNLMLEGMKVIGISKGPTRKAGLEKLVIADSNEVLSLPADDEGLHLLQHIRDEAHRFAITLHRKKREKKLTESSLQVIPGVGRVRRKLLLQGFGGLRELSRASVDEIAKISGISYDLALKIFKHFHGD
jgi:excinuclease ABC subunit C